MRIYYKIVLNEMYKPGVDYHKEIAGILPVIRMYAEHAV